MNKGRIMRRTHRLRKLRKQRRILRQRFHLRFFYRDKWMAGKMDQFKPKIVVLTGAGISAESGSGHSVRKTGCGKSTTSRMWRRRKAMPAIRVWCSSFTMTAAASYSPLTCSRTWHISPWRSWNRCWGITSCWSPRILITCMSGQVVSGLFICTASC